MERIAEPDRRFREWFAAPLGRDCTDPRFEVRRVAPEELPRLFDLVDEVFGTKRGNATFEWLYGRNPGGLARCWVVVERASGEFVACLARFPWPIALGEERLPGEYGGDLAVLPRWQRQGLYQRIIEVRGGHPWNHRTVVLGSPNEKSRGATIKAGLGHTIIGPFPFAVLPLDAPDYLRDHSWPTALAKPVGAVAGAALSAWHRMALHGEDVRIETIDRFDTDTASLALGCLESAIYWCPRHADFLNWRYLENPAVSYIVQAALIDERVRGYSVIRIDGPRATLMDFVAATESGAIAEALLLASIRAGREAGCNRLDFYATAGWRHWPLFHRAGFTARRSQAYRTARCPDRPDASEVGNWQILPGDSDVL